MECIKTSKFFLRYTKKDFCLDEYAICNRIEFTILVLTIREFWVLNPHR